MASRSKDSSPMVTRFFKPIIGEDCDKFMLLPPFFARKMEHLANQETEIEDCNGQRWFVTYSYVNNCLAFEKGWQEFYIDHDLKERQLLVFKYIEGSHFQVHIFGTSAGERMNFYNGVAPRKKRSRIEEQEQDIDGNPDTCFASRSEYHAQRVSTCIDEEGVLDCMINREYQGEDRSFLYDLNEFENVSNTNMAPSHTQLVTERADKFEKALESNVSPSHTEARKHVDNGSLSKDISEDVSKLWNGKCRRRIEDVDGRTKESFGKRRTGGRKCNEIVRPVRPAAVDHFSVEVNSLSYLELPIDIPSIPGIRDRGRGKVVYLRDPTGSLWPTFYPNISRGRALTTRWRAFCRKHNIKLGDECRFQAENSLECILYRVDVTHKSS